MAVSLSTARAQRRRNISTRSTTVIIDYEGWALSHRDFGCGVDPQTYGEWLAKQTEAQAEILGSKGRAKIFDGFAEKVGPKDHPPLCS